MKELIVASLLLTVFTCLAWAEETTCMSLDTREFGLVSDGNISEPWSEAELVLKYGPPCQILDLGKVSIERSRGRIVELGPRNSRQEKLTPETFAIKKQYIYKGDYSSGASVFTIVDGVVVKKERIF